MLSKVLVANRGEIALRILRTIREMGIASVAVYSDADASAPYLALADERIRIGPPPAEESYLRIDTVIEAAKSAAAEALHPGYGFLAENPELARRCEEEGIIFIGPTAKTLAAVGDKVRARRTMRSAGIPISEGSEGVLPDETSALEVAEAIGYPIILKAAGGGGGIGMAVVERPDDLPRAYRLAASTSASAFGNPDVLMERYHREARHIEVQILADAHGHTLHMGERECSIQRRYQKLVEEAPSPAVDEETRERIGRVAIDAAEAVDYTNAGTVEFLLADGEFLFNEVNARLQVEHPVTEMVTGVDLVREQLRIAAGEPLPFTQGEVALNGHALECRLYAEDPYADFAPSPGKVVDYRPPGGPGVRVDSGICANGEVSVYYDPLFAKVITHGPSREVAVARMKRALGEFSISGVETNIPLHLLILSDEDFVRGALTTDFVRQRGILEALEKASRAAEASREELVAAVAVAAAARPDLFITAAQGRRLEPSEASAWALAGRRELMGGGAGALHPGRRW